jgi:hypothetical protein
MAILLQKDKRSGLTYAYDSTSWWDKEKKQSRSKRKLIPFPVANASFCSKKALNCKETYWRFITLKMGNGIIGRLDKETGEIVPTDGRMKKPKARKPQAKLKEPAQCARLFYGATYLLDAIGDKLGLIPILNRNCFNFYLELECATRMSRRNAQHFERQGTLTMPYP